MEVIDYISKKSLKSKCDEYLKNHYILKNQTRIANTKFILLPKNMVYIFISLNIDNVIYLEYLEELNSIQEKNNFFVEKNSEKSGIYTI